MWRDLLSFVQLEQQFRQDLMLLGELEHQVQLMVWLQGWSPGAGAALYAGVGVVEWEDQMQDLVQVDQEAVVVRAEVQEAGALVGAEPEWVVACCLHHESLGTPD